MCYVILYNKTFISNLHRSTMIPGCSSFQYTEESLTMQYASLFPPQKYPSVL